MADCFFFLPFSGPSPVLGIFENRDALRESGDRDFFLRFALALAEDVSGATKKGRRFE